MARKRRKKTTKEAQNNIPAIIIPGESKDGVPLVNPSRIYQLFLQGNNSEVCDAIAEGLRFHECHNYNAINLETVKRINDFVSVVFALMTNQDFKIPNSKAPLLISRAHLFANLVRISSYGTTDCVLSHLLFQEHNYVKLLFLYTSRNSVYIPVKQLFDVNQKLASLWYFTYSLPTMGPITPTVYGNLQRHITEMDDRYTLTDHRVTPLYFSCTYYNDLNGADRRVKEILNRECLKVAAQVNVKNTPKRDSIAIITAKWFQNSAVYKSSSPLIERLARRYKLTLIHLGMRRPADLQTGLFDKVHYLQFDKNGFLNTEPIETNDFQLVYFPDIGMNDESVWLSNVRWAPIQVTSYGHPVSTFSSNMDYFFAGSESEVLEDLEKNYLERVVLLPGLGAHPTWPRYKAKYPEKRTDKKIVNCVWGPDKHSWPLYTILREAAEESGVPVEYQIFCSMGVNRYQGYLPFKAEVEELLPKLAKVHADKEYYDYMEEAEYADFAINSWPFGGYNTVIEALYLGKPIITMEGRKFYNKVCACLLRKVGLADLIAKDRNDFKALIVRLLTDADFLREKQEYLRNIDLRGLLFDTDEPVYFEQAIEYLIDNHEQLKAEGSHEPIIIKRIMQ